MKTYRSIRYQDFELDGDFDEEGLLLPSSEGFEQRRYQFQTNNEYSATVKAAVETICRTIRDPSLLSRLRQLSADIGQVSSKPSSRRRILPARLRRWQTLYDLSFDIIRGFGLTPGDSLHQIPGFIVSTWQVWQDLISRALIISFGNYSVKNQHGFSLGRRTKDGKVTAINTTPDSVICSMAPSLIVDAKYKGRNDKDNESIGDADFYETLAFMRGAATNRAVLVYPAISTQPQPTGETRVIEELNLANGETIWGISLEVNGIAEPGGFLRFVAGLKKQLVSLSNGAVSMPP